MKKVCSFVAVLCLSVTALHAQSIFDDFNDNSRDTEIWEAPVPDANEELTETNGWLEFTSPAGEETWIVQSIKSSPSYDQPWQIQTLISVDQSKFGNNEIGYMGMSAGGGGENENVEIGMAVGHKDDLPVFPFREVIFSSGDDVAEEAPYFFSEEQLDVIGVRMTYDPNTRMIRAYYDLDDDNADGEWTLFQSYTIDNSTVAGAETLNWGMTQFDTFYLQIYGGAEGNIAVASGTAWMDDFAFNLGSTAQNEPGFSDDFNDDSRSSDWSNPSVDSGTPELIERNHHLEFLAASSSGEQEISQSVGWGFLPQYDQAFEVKVEAHCLPAAMTLQDQVGGMDLLIGNDSGDGDLILSVAALYDAGSRKQVLASDNSEVDPLADWPESIEFGALPEVVGLRMVWAPDTKTMSCYFDTDGDRTVETWVLFADYTLDGSTNGTTHIADWSMSASNQFWINLGGFAESTIIDSGEAYFDNFQLVNAPLPPDLIGYDLWASAIPDPGMRATTDDASGNGIHNLLQYMYGLDPMATDTDVMLSIQMEGGFPVVYHGVNESATDYFIWYQLKNSLNDPWSFSAGDEATSSEFVQINGKTQHKLTFPVSPINNFIRLVIIPN